MDSDLETLKPRGVLEVVDAAADLLRRRPRDVAVIASVVVVPGIVFLLLAGLVAGEPGGSVDQFGALFVTEQEVPVASTIIALLIQSTLFSFVTFALTRVVVGEVMGVQVRSGGALVAAAKRTPTLLLLWFFVHVAEAVGALALGIGFVVAMCGLMVTVPVLAAEPGHTAKSAFLRSWRLTNGVRGRVFGVLLVLLVMSLVLNLVLVTGPLSLAAFFAGDTALWIIGLGLQAVVGIVVQGVVSGATIYTYLDLRVRREALDIELQLQKVL